MNCAGSRRGAAPGPGYPRGRSARRNGECGLERGDGRNAPGGLERGGGPEWGEAGVNGPGGLEWG
jgi:hypothetical protein